MGKRTAFVRTYTGKNLDLLNPDPDQIDIIDIAHHLAKLDRYNGACPELYSVGQHSLHAVEALPPDADKNLRLYTLLHDSSEIFCGDVVRPLKIELREYKVIEKRVMDAVCIKFGLDCSDYTPVKDADKAVMAAEMIQLHGWHDVVTESGLPEPAKIRIHGLSWKEYAKAEFLNGIDSIKTVLTGEDHHTWRGSYARNWRSVKREFLQTFYELTA